MNLRLSTALLICVLNSLAPAQTARKPTAPAGDSSGGAGGDSGGCPAASANGQGGSHDDEHGHEPQGKACGHNG